MLRPQQNETREMNPLDGFWEFEKSQGCGRADQLFAGLKNPRKIGVPGSWNEQYLDLYNHFSEGWYQKRFFISPSWENKRIFIYFGSVCQDAEVWLNGERLGSHIGPHLPFEFEISQHVKFGEENLLVVLADGTLRVDSLPPATANSNDLRAGWSSSFPAVAYDFFPFSGIHRPVYLYALDQEHLSDVHVQASHNNHEAVVHCEVEVRTPYTGAVKFCIDGQEVVEQVVQAQKISTTITIDQPRIWDIGCGNLYELNVVLETGGVRVDNYRVRFGIRNVSVEGNQFLLNGKPVHFKGFGKHEDFDVIGKGLSHPLIIKDYDLLEWIGANSFRTSHYPYAEEWLDIADERGVLVISENPFVGLGPRLYREDILKKACRVIEEHMTRDRNHPSVVMWSLANEPNSPGGLDTEEKVSSCVHFYEEMMKQAKSFDTSRPFTYAMHGDPEDNPMAHLFDVLCLNKYYGWYICLAHIDESLGDFIANLQFFYDEFKKPIILSEFGADAVSGEHHLPEVMFSEEFQSKQVETQYKALLKKPWFLGAHVWNFADFRVGQTLNRVIFNRKGVFTRARQPKLVAHTLRRLWRKEPSDE